MAVALGMLMSTSGAVYSEDDHHSLAVYGVTVNRTPVQSWQGIGVYLGNGLVLTAAHVTGWTFWTRPKVVIKSQEFATETIKEGSFESVDLTLLRIDQRKLPISLALRLNPICKTDPKPGLQVASVTPTQIALSQVLSPQVLPLASRRFATVIGDVPTTAKSGSGVFDIQRKCLLGIVSRKIWKTIPGSVKTQDIATYFVPASEIRKFIPAKHLN